MQEFTPLPTPADDPTLLLTQELIRRPSVSPEDQGCLQIIAQRLEAAGFRVERMPFGPVENIWALHGTERPLLCFAGHTDVVPTGPREEWHTDPFEPVIRDGILYGRGAADMKSGLAAMVVATERFVAKHPNHKGTLAFLLTSDEEGPSVDGTRRVMEVLESRNEKIDYCVVGEPSSTDKLGDVIKIGRRGSLSGKLTVHGVQGHVAYPHLADNPVHAVAPALAELAARTWDKGNEFFQPTTFQISNISAGTGAPNVIPGELKARFNIRFSTEQTVEKLQSTITEILNRHKVNYTLEWFVSGLPFFTAPGALSKAVVQAIQEKANRTPELSTTGGTSDGRFIAPTGAQVVELGVLNASIHKVNENVRVDDIVTLTQMYERVMELMLAK
ncbi:succinyl-diaminopimelate desuccinylase [Steroidobacter agaridevorans]|uniref:Succinyl-diaminopimelate desuccinylase n=1 Tax=Steroidobacter agaridevorans TaxID=2695856 RepID=A0A829YBR2_9GAMM|nr:succinyl-diaminopimelate desuccinylase [Steroidobacter agaridevorans]GFE87828.1 succinyl-diaminopimelate desuccinylase [Steroidobacter agaridevorans]